MAISFWSLVFKDMYQNQGQGNLFSEIANLDSKTDLIEELKLSRDLLEAWQKRITNHQSKLFEGAPDTHHQSSLFLNNEKAVRETFSPLSLAPLPLSFWRWPTNPHNGPAIYLVTDKLELDSSHILLYIGETIAAERRWKGEHDCKDYLTAYSEALANAGIGSQLSIRFWSDVPSNTAQRRKLEQKLIQQWLPPFNKETRNHWCTPFTQNLI